MEILHFKNLGDTMSVDELRKQLFQCSEYKISIGTYLRGVSNLIHVYIKFESDPLNIF